MPYNVQPHARTLLHDIYLAETERDANKAFNRFCQSYRGRYSTAIETLEKDRGLLMTFYHFQAAHWRHIRSTNVMESVFAMVRPRTHRTNGLGTRKETRMMASDRSSIATESRPEPTCIRLRRTDGAINRMKDYSKRCPLTNIWSISLFGHSSRLRHHNS